MHFPFIHSNLMKCTWRYTYRLVYSVLSPLLALHRYRKHGVHIYPRQRLPLVAHDERRDWGSIGNPSQQQQTDTLDSCGIVGRNANRGINVGTVAS
jgi:hypothetical protein